MNDIPNIYWFASNGLQGPSTRYRAFYPYKYLSNLKPSIHTFFYPKRSFRSLIRFMFYFLRALFDKNGLIVIQKVCSNKYYAKSLKILIRLKRKNTVYDIDDAEYIRGDSSTLNYFIKNVKTVTVGSEALKKYSQRFNANVNILTSPIIPHHNNKNTRNKITTIGWVGDTGDGDPLNHPFSHKRSLFEYLFPAIKNINKPIKLILIGVKNKEDRKEIKNYFEGKINFEIVIPEILEWEIDDWLYSDISNFDIGVSPMVNHPFNEAKSAFKAKQYLSCGVPVIASDVGDTNQFVIHGYNGYLSKNSKEFEKGIRSIMEMSDKEYFILSKNCKAQQTDFSLKGYCENLLKIGYN